MNKNITLFLLLTTLTKFICSSTDQSTQTEEPTALAKPSIYHIKASYYGDSFTLADFKKSYFQAIQRFLKNDLGTFEEIKILSDRLPQCAQITLQFKSRKSPNLALTTDTFVLASYAKLTNEHNPNNYQDDLSIFTPFTNSKEEAQIEHGSFNNSTTLNISHLIISSNLCQSIRSKFSQIVHGQVCGRAVLKKSDGRNRINIRYLQIDDRIQHFEGDRD